MNLQELEQKLKNIILDPSSDKPLDEAISYIKDNIATNQTQIKNFIDENDYLNKLTNKTINLRTLRRFVEKNKENILNAEKQKPTGSAEPLVTEPLKQAFKNISAV